MAGVRLVQAAAVDLHELLKDRPDGLMQLERARRETAAASSASSTSSQLASSMPDFDLGLPELAPTIGQAAADEVARELQAQLDDPSQELACILFAAYRSDLHSVLHVKLYEDKTIEWHIAQPVFVAKTGLALDEVALHVEILKSAAKNGARTVLHVDSFFPMEQLFRERIDDRFERLMRHHSGEMWKAQTRVVIEYKMLKQKPPGPRSWFLS